MASVLVVDDEQSFRDQLRDVLSAEGHEIQIAEEAESAIAILRVVDFDVIVADIILPGLSGLDLLKAIRKESPQVQVIMMTGDPDVERASVAVREGAFDYLSKPISNEALVNTVANASKVKSLDDERRRLEKENVIYRKNLEHLVDERTKALKRSEAFLVATGRMAKIGGFELDANSMEIRWTEEIFRIFEVPLEFKPTLEALLQFFHPDGRPKLENSIKRAIDFGEPYDMELKITTAAGKQLWTHTQCTPLVKDGKTIKLKGTFQDITRRKIAEASLRRANRAKKVLSACNQTLVRSKDEINLLQDICRIIVNEGGYRLAWVGFAENDETKSIRPVAQEGYEEGFLGTLGLSWADNKFGQGPTGTAIRTGVTRVAQTITKSADPEFTSWLARAKERGYASMIALPLISDNHTLGALNIFAIEPEAFDSKEIELLQELADDLAYGIGSLRISAERIRFHGDLERTKDWLSTLINASKDAIVAIDDQGKATLFNSAAEEMFGRKKEEMLGQCLCPLMPEEYRTKHTDAVSRYFKTGIAGRNIARTIEFTGLRADGSRFPLELSLSSGEHEGNRMVVAIIRDITERGQAKEKLLKSELRYRTLFENSPISFWEEDFSALKRYIDDLREKGVSNFRAHFNENPEDLQYCSGLIKVLDVNKATLRLYKAKSKEELFKGLASVFRKKSLDVFLEEIIELSEGKTSFCSEMFGRTLNGENLDTEIFLSVVPGYEKSWAKVFLADINIADRKRMERELKIRTLQQEAIAKLGQMGLTVISLSEFLNETVRVVSRVLKVDYSKILELLPDRKNLLLRAGIGWAEGLAGHSIVSADKDSQAGFTLISKEPVVVEDLKTEKRFSGPPLLTEHNVVSGLSVLIGDLNNPYGVLGAHTTECREFTRDDVNFLESAANLISVAIHRVTYEEERTRLVTAIEQVLEIIIITDSKHNIQYVNPAFLKVSGYSYEEVIGRSASILNTSKHPASFYQDMSDSLDQGLVWKGRIFNKRKDGSHYSADLAISPIWDKKGEIINFISVSRDVSQEVEMEKKLIQAQKMEAIGTLAGGIAHDFNNMLCVITGYSQLGLSLLSENDKFKGYFQSINNAGIRSQELVKQILTFSRQSEKNLETLSIVPLIKEAIKFLRASLPTTIEISQKIQPDCGKIMADPTQIHQVVMNLCTNAGYAMREKGGLLSIRLSDFEVDDTNLPKPDMELGNYVELTVEDTGAGIPAETLERIFEPFFTTKPAGDGTGMGLSVVHGIVEDYGGAIKIESKEGEGSKFEVFFPVAKEIAETKDEEASSAPNGNESILFVDDEEMLVQLEKEMAESFGYNVTVAHNGWQALEIFESQADKFDLVITDQTMPGMTGVELAKEIWDITPDMPIILTTGFSHAVDEDQARDMGFSDFFKKPLDRKMLGNKIRKVLDRKK